MMEEFVRLLSSDEVKLFEGCSTPAEYLDTLHWLRLELGAARHRELRGLLYPSLTEEDKASLPIWLLSPADMPKQFDFKRQQEYCLMLWEAGNYFHAEPPD